MTADRILERVMLAFEGEGVPSWVTKRLAEAPAAGVTLFMAVNVMRNGQSVYLREQPFGGNELTQDIQNKFGLAPEEAE